MVKLVGFSSTYFGGFFSASIVAAHTFDNEIAGFINEAATF